MVLILILLFVVLHLVIGYHMCIWFASLDDMVYDTGDVLLVIIIWPLCLILSTTDIWDHYYPNGHPLFKGWEHWLTVDGRRRKK